MSLKDALFVAQSRVIRRLAAAGPCVIVGRCSDYVLRDMPGCLNVFVHANTEYKSSRAVSNYSIAAEKAEAHVAKINSARAAHYAYYTGKRWGDPRNYDAVFDSSRLTTREIVEAIACLYKG